MNNETIGLSLRRWRLSNNLSQMQVSKAVGVSRPAVSMWEAGHNLPRDLATLPDAYKMTREQREDFAALVLGFRVTVVDR